jgi:hypothetical protein
MRKIAIAALLVAACQSANKEAPESRVEVRPSPDYEKVRPVTIALLPVKAPRADIQINVRQEVYRLLSERKYSPFKLTEVDAHIDSQGRFDAETLDWDATFEIVFDEYAPSSGDYWAASGHAVMKHKTGEILWACDFENYAFLVPSRSGTIDHSVAAKEIAYFLVGGETGKSRLPDCPPPPPG